MDHEDAVHDEAMAAVAAGQAAVLSDEPLPGVRYQTVAVIQLGDVVLTQWEERAGNWKSKLCLWLKPGAAGKLAGLLEVAGYRAEAKSRRR